MKLIAETVRIIMSEIKNKSKIKECLDIGRDRKIRTDRINLDADYLQDLYYNKHMGLREIANHFHVSHETVRIRLKNYGLLTWQERNKKIRNKELVANVTCATCKNEVNVDGEFAWKTNECRKCYNSKKRMVRKEQFSKINFNPDDFLAYQQCIKCKNEKIINEFRFRKDLYNYVTTCKFCENKIKHSAELQKRRSNPAAKLRHVVSNSVRNGLKKNNGFKNCSTWKKLPYSPQELKDWLEKQFECWMNWGNYGLYDPNRKTWQIDHIVAHSKLPYDSLVHPNFLKCWDLKNLRPLECKENMSKGAKTL